MKPRGEGGGFPVSSFIRQTIKCVMDICVLCPAVLLCFTLASSFAVALCFVTVPILSRAQLERGPA